MLSHALYAIICNDWPALQEGMLRKAAGKDGTVSLVDLYGTLLSSRLYVPSDVTQLDPRHLSLHNFRLKVDTGDLPLPILSAIQHGKPRCLYGYPQWTDH